ncbi:hypothetical protein [Enterococcus avium]|uniref:hypothetical protein n=1 Tax=Enterococcus avium TaxID=33945 RepID=UPI0022E5D345|nr:hypothetical protein [Enterococcus avium]
MDKQIGVSAGFVNPKMMNSMKKFDKSISEGLADINFRQFGGSQKQKQLTRKNKMRKK